MSVPLFNSDTGAKPEWIKGGSLSLYNTLKRWHRVTERTRTALVSNAHSMAPMLLGLTLTAAAHAQGTIDFSGASTVMGSFKTFAIFAGAIIAFGCLIWAGLKMMGGRFQDAIPQLFGALFGAGVLGWGAGWIGSLTGQTLP